MTRLNFYSFIKYILSVLFISSLFSCSNNEHRLIQPSSRIDLKKVRLGDSKYYLKLPGYFEITEARGKEGGLGYNIIPKDTSSKMFAFVEVEQGGGIGDTRSDSESPIEKIHSTFLNKPITWRIYQTPTGYFEAYTPEIKVNAYVTSNKRNEIDSLISFISTLNKE
jgi:hypothetical protein